MVEVEQGAERAAATAAMAVARVVAGAVEETGAAGAVVARAAG